MYPFFMVFYGNVVNQTYHSVPGESLKIKSSVPARIF